jgi:hypothetical protein
MLRLEGGGVKTDFGVTAQVSTDQPLAHCGR